MIATNHSRSFVARLGGWIGTIGLERAGTDGVRLAGLAELGDYHRVGPLLFENARHDRLALAESPIGRLMAIGLSGGVFRKTNFIESPGWSVPVFGIAVLVLLTAFIQLRRKAPTHLRRRARFALLGLTLVIVGLLAEFQWGVALGIVQGSIVLPAIWRLALHFGAVMLVWQAILFLRVRGVPIGRVSRGHGILLAAAGCALVVAIVAWRVFGAFPPYFGW